MTRNHYLAMAALAGLAAAFAFSRSTPQIVAEPGSSPAASTAVVAAPPAPTTATAPTVAATPAQAGKLASTEVWKRAANQTITQALNQPDFIQQLALTDWQCNEQDCRFELAPGPQAGSLTASVGRLMQTLNTDTEIRVGMSGISNGPTGRRAQLVYYREAQPAPRYTAKQMTEAMNQAAAQQRQQDQAKP